MLESNSSSSTDSTIQNLFSPSSETIKTEEVELKNTANTPRRFLAKRWQKIAAGVSVVLLLLLSVAGALGFYTYTVVKDIQAQTATAQITARAAYDGFKTQNLPASEASLKELQTQLLDVRATYNKLSFYRFVPIANAYYNDGIHGLNAADAGLSAGLETVAAITPYADVLGFAGEGTFTGGTLEDRMRLLLETLSKVTPQIDSISADMQVVNAELSEIDPSRYPENLQGHPLRSYIQQATGFSGSAVTALTDYRPILEQLPAIAGSGGERRKYLILFQNDNELRPTGGFLTAYAIIYLEDGKVTPEKSDDIYELDKKFAQRLPIPTALGRYLTTERYWNLRDMNVSPDFNKSMDQFLTNYKTVRGEPQDIDGVIAIDTHVLTELVEILGPVNVPGYGTFTAENDPRCDCPNIIYELSNIITRPTPYLREDRKGILGPMMRELLTKFYTAPKQQWPLVFEAALGTFDERGKGGWIGSRNLQTYFYDEDFQRAADAISMSGRMTAGPEGSDFLGVVDANLGGAKSNLFITSDIKHTVSAPENGRVTNSVEITYKNSRRGDNCNLEAGLLCLNSTLRDWHRLYLPLGAELVDAQGFTQEPKEYEEDGFQVLDGFFTLEPNSQAKIRVTYTVPYTDTETYRVKYWKQGGISAVPILLDVNGSQEELLMNKDTSVEVAF
ncbi:MAG: DUF4012 domain-containing protein [bacterium]|nr:DUF4012 domain-containing protein [bacterium]